MYDIIMDIVKLGLEYEPFEEINKSFDARQTVYKRLPDCGRRVHLPEAVIYLVSCLFIYPYLYS